MSPAIARSSWVRHGRRRLPSSPPLAPVARQLPRAVLREPVRLVAPTVESPFAPGREVAFARIEGGLLEGLGIRDGDHVALERRDSAEHGDLAAVAGPDGRAGLWKVYPEGDRLRLSMGNGACRWTGERPRVHGVVVGVLRKWDR